MFSVSQSRMRVGLLLCLGMLGLSACGVPQPPTGITSAKTPLALEQRPVLLPAASDPWQKHYQRAEELLQLGEVSQAIALIQFAAEKGNIAAHAHLARLYQENKISAASEDIDSSSLMLYHLRVASEGGNPRAQTMLAALYENGDMVQKNLEEAVRYYRAAAEAGDVEAQYNLGLIFADRASEHYAPNLAALLWQWAAEQGNAEASARLGWLIYRGEGVSQDTQRAVELWQEASKRGVGQAYLGLGEHSSNDQDAQADYSLAASYLERALQSDSDEAILPLAELYRSGKGVIASDTTARRLYQQAAKGDDGTAHYWLGIFAYEGRGGAQDMSLARQSLQRAHDLGDTKGLPILIEIMLGSGEEPRRLLNSYFASIDANNAEELQAMLSLVERYNLSLADYRIPQQQYIRLSALIAENGDVAIQRQLAEQAAQNGDFAKQLYWLEKAASTGDIPATLALSILLETQDPARSLMLDQQLALQNNPQGQYRFGKHLIAGSGIAQDLLRGLNLLRKAAGQGLDLAAFEAAELLAAHDKNNHNAVLTDKLYTQASEGGIAAASLALSRRTDDLDMRGELLRRASTQGSARAALSYAEQQRTQPGIPWPQRAALYQQASQGGLSLGILRLAEYRLYHADLTQARNDLATIASFTQNADPEVRIQALELLARLYTTGFASIDLASDIQQATEFYDRLEKLDSLRATLGRAALVERTEGMAAAISYWQQAAIRSPWARYRLAESLGDSQQRSSLYRQAALGGVSAAYAKISNDIKPDAPYDYRSAMFRERAQHLAAGHYWAMRDQADDFAYGYSGTPDLEQARLWYERAAELGRPDAMTRLGVILGTIPEQHAEAEQYLRKAIALGETAAMAPLGHLIATQNPDDAAGARQLWEQAANLGNKEAQLALAQAWDQGFGGEQNSTTAFNIYRELFDLGYKQALLPLAQMYITGRGTETNTTEGIVLLNSAGNQGDSRAWLQLGKIFADPALPKLFDPNKASGFFLLAAHSNTAEAWYQLGQLYDQNGALPFNYALAYQYYAKAAVLGESDAQYHLGLGYRYGRGGLDSDPLYAYAWLALAAEQGDIAASMMRDSVLVDFQDGDFEQAKSIINTLKEQVAASS